MEEGEELQKNTKNIQQIMEIRQRFQIFFFFSSKQVTASFFFFFYLNIQFSGCWYSHKVMWLSLLPNSRTFSSIPPSTPAKKTLFSLAVAPYLLSLKPWKPLTYLLSPDLPILDITYKWNHKICSLLCLFHLACSQGLFIQQHETVIYFFLQLNTSVLCT